MQNPNIKLNRLNFGFGGGTPVCYFKSRDDEGNIRQDPMDRNATK